MRIALLVLVALPGWFRLASVPCVAQDLSDFHEEEQAAKTDSGWPRKVAGDDLEMTVYQPQVDSWDQVTLQLRAAVSVKKTGSKGLSADQSVPCGTLSSSTKIVMRIAMTPSLKASRRFRFKSPLHPAARRSAAYHNLTLAQLRPVRGRSMRSLGE